MAWNDLDKLEERFCLAWNALEEYRGNLRKAKRYRRKARLRSRLVYEDAERRYRYNEAQVRKTEQEVQAAFWEVVVRRAVVTGKTKTKVGA